MLIFIPIPPIYTQLSLFMIVSNNLNYRLPQNWALGVPQTHPKCWFHQFWVWLGQINEYSSPLSFGKYGILHFLGKFGANFGTPRAQFWGNLWVIMFETITTGLSGVENGGIGTKMSILALLVSEIWWFYPFWGGLGQFWGPMAQFWDNRWLRKHTKYDISNFSIFVISIFKLKVDQNPKWHFGAKLDTLKNFFHQNVLWNFQISASFEFLKSPHVNYIIG